jgi:hypothetical protein
MDDALDHARLLALSKELKRPLYTLTVLQQDPFTAGQAGRLEAAQWFAELWHRFDIKPGAHLRRIHYLLVSQVAGSVLMPDGSNYLNLDRPCYDLLNSAALDARYLGLVPADDLVDRRNDEPVIFLPNDASDAELVSVGGLLENTLRGFEVPRLKLISPTILQRYHLEIWCEKTTVNDVLLPLCERYGINLITGSGEQSLTACVNVVKRALASGRPVRILYVSDFDPAGASMPVAVARKIEFRLYQEGLDGGALDIQVRPIVLTHDQCIRYRLPRTPIKDTETRAAAFEARFGEGATELDALEALHPGELERILTREIGRYYDADLDDRIEEVAAEVETDIEAINAAVAKKNAKAIATLKAEHKKLAAAVKAYEKKAKPILRKIEKDLEAEAPDAESYDWPEPNEGDEDDDPLFDSTREYLEQVDRYKEHQGKPTESTRKPYDFYPAKCACCGKAFKATSRNTANACSGACREQLRRDKASAAKPLTPCVTCGALFNSIRGAETCSDKCRKKLRRKAVRS